MRIDVGLCKMKQELVGDMDAIVNSEASVAHMESLMTSPDDNSFDTVTVPPANADTIRVHPSSLGHPLYTLYAHQEEAAGQYAKAAAQVKNSTAQMRAILKTFWWEKPTYRLPRLAETQQMRIALQKAQLKNPKEPHVRMLFANFSTPCRNNLPKFEWPPPVPQPEPANVKHLPPKRRRTRIKTYQFDQQSRGPARQSSFRSAVNPQRSSGKPSTQDMHSPPTASKPVTVAMESAENGEPVLFRQERMGAVKKALEEGYRRVPEPVPE
ncbi:hypothetical protein BC832DRAFT_541751 [Gaertneriomyces semiglobifer]|nr:hypothetical protein BC832DRAFT_541751 [Gaertneriomyces semiglobifer]